MPCCHLGLYNFISNLPLEGGVPCQTLAPARCLCAPLLCEASIIHFNTAWNAVSVHQAQVLMCVQRNKNFSRYMSTLKQISKYRSGIMKLRGYCFRMHSLVGFDAGFSYVFVFVCLFFLFFWGGTLSFLEGKKNFTSCIFSGRVVMFWKCCFLALTKLCFAADLSNCEDVWFQGIMCHAYKLISRLNCY